MAPIAIHSNGAAEIDVHQLAERKYKEMTQGKDTYQVDFEKFYGYEPNQVDRRFTLALSDLSYLPKIDNPRADWVVNAALNAYKAYQGGGLGTVQRFATVGTGSGTDVIAALDLFPQLLDVALTDLHTDVVQAAKRNVLSAAEKADERIQRIARNAAAHAGDVLLPLKGEKAFDLIYENLPNIPLSSTGDLGTGQTSSTYIGDRTTDKIPAAASAALLDLHYVCLKQARALDLLAPGGTILSSMGGRVPLPSMLAVAQAAGYSARILTLSWKAQSEPEAVIGGYADAQKTGLGPFFFYPVAALARVFAGWTPAGAALCASQVEARLAGDRLDAVQALEAHRAGVEVGHTVVVMASVLEGGN